MADKPFDWSKPFQTRDGRKARLLASDLANDHPCVVAIERFPGSERLEVYTRDGFTFGPASPSERDLVNTDSPTERTVFLVVYPKAPYAGGKWYWSREVASLDVSLMGRPELARIIPVEIEE